MKYSDDRAVALLRDPKLLMWYDQAVTRLGASS